MDDLIKRQDTIDAVDQYISQFDAIDVNFLDGLKTAINIINRQDAIAAIEKWIPVSEILPEEDKNVLVTVHFHGVKNPPIPESYYVEVADQIDGEWRSYSDEYKIRKDRHEVIAWMPLPEPYKDSK